MLESKKPLIELEYRACISEGDFLRLRDFFNDHANNLGDDNKDTFFFIWPDKVVKVVCNDKTQKAKIVLKPGRVGKCSHFEEYELALQPEDVDRAVDFIKMFGPEDVQYTYQFRTNYVYKGVEIALKYTESWGFHIELEIMMSDISQKEEAEKKIREVADELGLIIMTDEELKEYTDSIDGGHMFGIYKKDNFPYQNFL